VGFPLLSSASFFLLLPLQPCSFFCSLCPARFASCPRCGGAYGTTIVKWIFSQLPPLSFKSQVAWFCCRTDCRPPLVSLLPERSSLPPFFGVFLRIPQSHPTPRHRTWQPNSPRWTPGNLFVPPPRFFLPTPPPISLTPDYAL